VARPPLAAAPRLIEALTNRRPGNSFDNGVNQKPTKWIRERGIPRLPSRGED
jgi:hypothetical protein